MFDQAIYSKAQQIRWGNKIFSERVILRLCAFHTSLAMLACIGKRFRDAGLETLVIEVGIVAQGSLDGAMNGHHCNRSIRMHKCVVEAMECLRWQSFLDSLAEEDKLQAQRLMTQLNATFPEEAFTELVSSDLYQNVTTMYDKFVNDQSKNPSFAVWSSYIEMVEVVLLFLLQPSQIQRDEEEICKVVTVLEAMINPFEDSHDQLVHIASGTVASKEVCADYINAREKGDAAFISNCKERLQSSEGMFKPLMKEKTKTFQSMNKSTQSKVKGKQVTLMADRNLFQRLVIIIINIIK